MKTVFFLSLFLIVYTYIIYPTILWCWARFLGKPIDKNYIEPTVSIIIAAFNEERYIRNKIENCLNLNYPKEKLEIIVVSDGSDDGTEAILLSFGSNRLRSYRYKERRGKAYALNLGISQAHADILFFTDARQVIGRDSLRELVANFYDPTVAVASGELLLPPEDDHGGVGLYWKAEKWMRKKESAVHSVLGATGSIYACRKEFTPHIPTNTILDDMMIPFGAILKGYRSVFEPKAYANDPVPSDINREFRRKVRTLSGNYQVLLLEPSLLNPRKNPVFFQFISHKIARLLVPFSMIVLLVSNVFLFSPFYRECLIIQLVFYISALSSAWGPRNWAGKMMKTCNTIVVLNFAALIGFFKFIKSPQKIEWEKST